MALSPKERMKIPRQKMPEQEPQKRAHNFEEVPLGFEKEVAMTEAARCLECHKPKCIGGCPVEIDIPKFVAQVAEGDFRSAAKTLKEANSLPAICGRVCPQEEQCENNCVLTKRGESVGIGRLERFVADWERQEGGVELPEIAAPTGKKVAIIGSGPPSVVSAAASACSGSSGTSASSNQRRVLRLRIRGSGPRTGSTGTTSRGGRMAFIHLSDRSGAYEITAFSEVLNVSREMLDQSMEAGAPVLVTAEVRSDEIIVRLHG